ncbi:putative hydrolases or acyltransferases (alpha/beta hydrolase superfamily) [Gaiella occulta]|uniref:Putative hydrolases or acyltransferases (Alpha/beta hydrolase superfamily) n=1 Tax=Gaiella occulta TaxID=1002870 RepID=A0A7M2YWF6_9ACTN|nr:alpha/beta fold hydrolase [Gaiella occulta]RDI73909.1 putative hydrolases or acyltransferases (alpha/beta hydrolase superfamily) [Gaiella occulta]
MLTAPTLVRTPDGRTVAARAAGPRSSRALYVVDGTPSGGVLNPMFVEAATALDLACVTHARPGYGDSTRQPGRAVADVAADVAAVAAAFDLDTLHVVGWSGGGPHALACAALLPGLVRSAATLAGVAPWQAEGLDWLDGMAAENVAEFGAALEGEEALFAALDAQRDALANVTAADVAAALGGLVAGVDLPALEGRLGEWLAATFREAVRTGVRGWVDDDLAFIRDWGFDLAGIRVPVSVWQGDQDLMVPLAHGAWLAGAIPGARSRLIEGEGHLSLALLCRAIVAEVVGAAP